ncbi:MAG: response regulator transcription factor [Rhodospirillales bacterium]|nr:response regulator transcription factor [Rhodospirillales bacterium]
MRILIADDHHLVRESLRFYVEKLSPNTKVYEAEDFESALKNAHKIKKLDLILLDLVMPGMNGFEGLEIMQTNFPNIPIALLSGTPIEEEKKEQLFSNKISYIAKNLKGEELLFAVQETAAGRVYSPKSSFEGEEHAFPNFTNRESSVVKLLAQGLKNSDIAAQLGITEITVKIHMGRIFKKLKVDNRLQASKKANELGWRALLLLDKTEKTANK